MNKRDFLITVFSIGILFFSTTSCNSQKNNGELLKTSNDTLSWVIGENIARTVVATELEYNNDIVLKAVEATLRGEASPLNDSCFNEILAQLSFIVQKTQQENAQKLLHQQDSILQQLSKENTGIKRHESGIYYQVLKEGKGKCASEQQRIRFNYEGRLLDGNIFDSSFGGNGIQTLPKNVLPGLCIGLCTMNAGSRCIFYIPSRMAFGKAGDPSLHIPSNSIVVYEIELYEIYND